MNEELEYIKTKNGNILKCYVSEQMHQPIYYPVNSKTNGYVDYYEVEKFLKIDDMYLAVKELQQENKILKENAIHNDKVVDKVNWENNLLKQQLKDKDEKISNLIKLLVEMVFDDINDLGVYQELVARHLVKLGYIVKEDGFYKELETNKED